MARTEAEVTRAVRQLERKRDNGSAGKTGRTPTVAEWFETWLTTIAPPTVSQTTLDSTYGPKVRRWIIPQLGRHRLDRLRPEHLRRSAAPRSVPTEVHQAQTPSRLPARLHSPWTYVCPVVKRPCGPGCQAHARECPQRTDGDWHFTHRKGVRAGQGKAKLILALPAPLIDQLKAHRRQQNAERLAAGEARQDWDPVFCTPVGAPIDSRDDWADWQELLRAAGLREARVHDARHTAATLLLEQGVGIRVVQEILGHSRLSQTERYTHVTRAMSRHAADRMSEALWE